MTEEATNTTCPLSSACRPLTWVLLICVGLYVALLGTWGLFDPDEGRYAEIPREMIATGDWVTPRLDYVKYFEKPPLLYWFVASTMTALGQNEYAARLGCALPAVLGVLFVFWFTRRLFNARAAFMSAVVLATSMLYFGQGHVLTTDTLLSVLMAAAGLIWWLGNEDAKRRLAYYLAAGVLLGAAVLAKGPVAFVLMGAVIVVYTLWTRRWSATLCAPLLAALVAMAVVAVPWFVLVMQRNTDFAHFFFWVQHVERFLPAHAAVGAGVATPSGEHAKPAWWFIMILIAGMIPWTAYLPAALKSPWAGKRSDDGLDLGRLKLFLMLWSIIIFAFFSASSCKLMPYILPIFPMLAILVGAYFANMEKAGANPPRAATIATALFALLGAAALPIYAHGSKDIPMGVLMIPLILGIPILAVWGIALLTQGLRGKPVFAILAAGVIAFEFMLLLALPAVAPFKSVREPALKVKALLRPGDLVAQYRCLNQSVCFYTGQRTILLSGDSPFGTEILFGYQAEPEATRFWGRESDTAAEELLRGEQRVYFVVPEKGWQAFQQRFAGLYTEVGHNADRYFVVNTPPDR